MQNSVDNSSQRVSPDIINITSINAPVSSMVESTGSLHPNVSLPLNTISEIPPGFYEFVFGDNGEIKILCKICGYTSNKKSNFKRHFTNMHSIHHDDDCSRSLECCGIRFITKGEKSQHTKSVHKSGYRCSICTKVFDRPALLQRHLAKHTGKKPYKCSLCTYQTPNKANAKRHIEKKHSDVQEGSILFLTDDGEQIQMETVSKTSRNDQDRLSVASPTMVVKSNADSTSSPVCPLDLTRLTSETVTSSTASPPGCIAKTLMPIFPTDFKIDIHRASFDNSKKRQISHSVEVILKSDVAGLIRGSSASAKPKSVTHCNNPSNNELHMGRYCAPNWTHVSSRCPSDYVALNQPFYQQANRQKAYASSAAANHASLPLIFRQCAHGCWHLEDNQTSSELSRTPLYESSMSLASALLNPTPDSRSLSSASQTENSSSLSQKSEDDDESEYIDVVGDDDEEDGVTGLQLLSTICDEVGTGSTEDNENQEGNAGECDNKMKTFVSPPVDSEHSVKSNETESDEHERTLSDTDEYIPKKLRVSRAYYKYSNLYMFELEFPLDAFEVINETSLCVSGVQSYSKKCEVLQLCVPPKLLRSENEEGLCKDRDFKILSGGYADGRIRQIKCLPKYQNLVATLQDEYNGIIVHEVGNDDRATILEKNRLSTNTLPELSSSSNHHKSLCSMNNRIVLGAAQTSKAGLGGALLLHEWETGSDESLTRDTPTNTYTIWENASNLTCGQIVKMKEWDMNTCIFLTTHGTIALYDLRNGKNEPDLFFHSTKSSNNAQLSAPSTIPVIFSFDCLPPQSKVGVLDSCGGYETCDVRFVKKNSSEEPTLSRTLLPEFTTLAGVYPEWFNIEYEPLTEMMREKERNRFIISGTKKECVPVFQEPEISSDSDSKPSSESLQSVFAFSHDGHSKPVSHSIWHPVAKNLVFSASVDAVLHAWQFSGISTFVKLKPLYMEITLRN
ncbi:WD repeat-containing protein 73 [Orchesella cincta]|uniref:WD repeat-containing protein 73 n=1 Tax=Orchesella cincta TaxID=48709 RepID=A0A1D2N9H4_ORCCI|nr:WD repeat-containing protein 73 [Orchesella cincta]